MRCEIRDAVIAQDGRAGQALPAGRRIPQSIYDTTIFVRDSIKAVVTTLLEAVLLVVLVVILFLQTWRASIIPLIAVPVSIVGTFAALYLLGFSINTLTLFGLVLAIGIVVDDAIVVVENVERNIEEGRSAAGGGAPGDEGGVRADHRDRAGAVRGVRADGLPVGRHRPVLQAVRGDHRHLDGDLGDQLADAVAGAGGASCCKAARRAEGRAVARDRARCSAGCSVRSTASSSATRSATRARCRACWAVAAAVFAVYAVLLVATGLVFQWVPRGFIPIQDKLYLIAGVKLPEGASIERTDAALKKVAEIAMSIEGVANEVAFPGLNPLQFTNTPEQRRGVLPAQALRPASQQRRGDQRRDQRRRSPASRKASPSRCMPPPIQGLGNGSGYSLFIEDRANLGYGALQNAVQAPSRARPRRRRAWAFRSAATRPTCRSSTPKSIASRPRRRACR